MEVERQTPGSGNMDVGNGIASTDQCENNWKLDDSDQS